MEKKIGISFFFLEGGRGGEGGQGRGWEGSDEDDFYNSKRWPIFRRCGSGVKWRGRTNPAVKELKLSLAMCRGCNTGEAGTEADPAELEDCDIRRAGG